MPFVKIAKAKRLKEFISKIVYFHLQHGGMPEASRCVVSLYEQRPFIFGFLPTDPGFPPEAFLHGWGLAQGRVAVRGGEQQGSWLSQ